MAAKAVDGGQVLVAAGEATNINANMENEQSATHNENSKVEENNEEQIYQFGFNLNEAYKLSLSFYRKAQSAVNLAYSDRLQLMAYWKQESCGKYDESKPSDVGYLDVIGSDRRKAWQNLGAMTQADARKHFCELLEKISPEYTAFMGAQQKDVEEKERLRMEELERKKREEEERRRIEAEKLAEKMRLEEEERLKAKQEAEVASQQHQQNNVAHHVEEKQQVKEKNDDRALVLAKASLWTRPKLQEFIQHVKRDASSFLVVGRGETVTIRVPTHENGSCLFWEFGTETYDIGFGVYFESVPQLSDRSITVHIDESDASEGEEEETQKPAVVAQDNASTSATVPPVETQVIEILPVLRRNSHNDVIVGSHVYPGQGVYLLKFDNSYSLFRSKSLYYRVYYTK